MRRQTPTATERAYEYMRKMILDMSVMPGTRVDEFVVAEKLGVSRTPVHEAVRQLATEGLIEVLPRSGTYVARIPLDELEEAMIIRTALELVVAEHAAQKITELGIERLRSIVARQRAHIDNRDRKGFHRDDEMLHKTLAKIAGLPNAWSTILKVKMHVDRYRILTLPIAGRMEEVWEEHVALIEAVISKDPKAAVKAMQAHLNHVLPAVEPTKKMNPSFFTGHLKKPAKK